MGWLFSVSWWCPLVNLILFHWRWFYSFFFFFCFSITTFVYVFLGLQETVATWPEATETHTSSVLPGVIALVLAFGSLIHLRYFLHSVWGRGPKLILLKLSRHHKMHWEETPPLLFFGVNYFYKCKVKLTSEALLEILWLLVTYYGSVQISHFFWVRFGTHCISGNLSMPSRWTLCSLTRFFVFI